MSIWYRLESQIDNLNPEGKKKTGLYPRIVSKKTVDLSWVAKRAAAGTAFATRELEVAMQVLLDQIVEELKEGNNVCLSGFGTFSLSAESVRTPQEKDEIRAESIRVKKIVFKTSQRLMKHLRTAKFERMPQKE